MSDVRERIEEQDETSEAAGDHRQSQMWTALPVRIESYDAEKQTVTAVSSVKASIRKKDGKVDRVELPNLEDVPVQFPGAGGVTMTFPIKKGDEGIMIFSSRSIDQWHQSGGTQQQINARMHDLSDGMFIPGMRAQPRRLKNVSTTSTQVRSDDDQVKQLVDIHPTTGLTLRSEGTDGKKSSMAFNGGSVTFHADTELKMTSPKMSHNGKNISGNHKHLDVMPGSAKTGIPEDDA